MFEYQDDFLMGQTEVSKFEEGANQFCHASRAAEDQLAELALLVGKGATLNSQDAYEPIELVNSAPPLEFDLESELSKAFNGEQEPELSSETALPELFNTSAIEQALAQPLDDLNAQSSLPIETEPLPEPLPETLSKQDYSDPAAEPDLEVTDLDTDFSDMIANELDRALAEEVQADLSLLGTTEGQVSESVDVNAELDAEFAKLLGNDRRRAD